jgi:hypothetical protein
MTGVSLRRFAMGTKRFFRFLFSSLIVLIFTAGSLLAFDIYVKQQTKTEGERSRTPTVSIQHIWIAKDSIRFEDMETHQVMIVRLDKDLIWMIDMEKKLYKEATLDQFKQMRGPRMEDPGMGGSRMGGPRMGGLRIGGSRMGGARMGGPGMGGEEEIKVKKTGNEMKIKGWHCYEVLITVKGGVNMESSIWLTEEVEVPGEECRKYMEMFGGLFYRPKVIEKWKDIRGYPIRSHTKISMRDRNMETESEVFMIDTSPIPASVFELPSGLTKEELSPPWMPR